MRTCLAVAVVALVGCRNREHRELEPRVVEEARGATRLVISPSGELTAEVCDGGCKVDGKSGTLLGWSGDRLLRLDGQSVKDQDDTAVPLPVREGAFVHDGGCNDRFCAVIAGEELVRIDWAGKQARAIAGGLNAVTAAVVDPARPVAYVASKTPPSLRAIDLETGQESWQAALIDCDARGALLVFTGDGRVLVATQFTTYDSAMEPCDFAAIDLADGRVIHSDDSGPSQIAAVATHGPRTVVYAKIRHPHAHSGGYDRPSGIAVLDVDTWKLTEWRHPFHEDDAPLYTAIVVKDGKVLVTLE